MEMIKQFKALSDPTRLRLLNILNETELNVNEIVSIVDMIQSGVSRHLKILLESGLLSSRKQGSFIYYSANQTNENQTLIEYVCSRARSEEICLLDLERARQSIVIRKNRSRRFFSTVAPQWDRLKKEVLGDLDLTRILRNKIHGASAVADLGCGTGEMLASLYRNRPKELDPRLIGVDSSPEMLEQARIRLPTADSIDLRLGELENLPMRDREVDGVILSMVLFHIFEPQKAIAEVSRVLKPGGLFLLADFERHEHEEIKKIIGGAWLGFPKEKIESWLGDTDFEVLEIQSFQVEHGLCINLFTARKTNQD